ncbi:DJ-1/PfpI family protein [Limnovirga soli]|uniref:DJ-1/PfpI family protein n=1 Tax=Limnovirga soli TaxID=2656915 RepID=A0A8J8FAK4_9BACT|nr:DJ-1/PfpI family protein [Limnovirga soli]NNV54027.1 DJ-1/PfpI family protein [Limnovirga soli]
MRKIAILIFNDVEVLDFAGPFEVFSVTGKRGIGEAFEVFTVAETQIVNARNRLTILPTYTFETCPFADILLVPGGGGYHSDGAAYGSRKEMNNPLLLKWIQKRALKAELILSVCSGAPILAKANLLRHKKATTHFMAIESLKEAEPTITVYPEERFVDNGNIILSAGISAGIDMALYVVKQLSGKEAAIETAKYMQYEYFNVNYMPV